MEINDTLRKYTAEFIGTFGLIFIGGLSVMEADAGHFGLFGIAIAHFLVLTFMVYFARPYSGAHFNPSVTIGFLVTKKITLIESVYYIITQLVASICAGIMTFVIAGKTLRKASEGKNELGFPHLNGDYSILEGVVVEIVLTFFLVFVIWAVAVDNKAPSSIYGVAIGGAVAFDILAAGPITGAAMNPARVFGPALIAGNLDHQLIYWVGPIIGAIFAALLYNIVFIQSSLKPETA